VTTAPAKRRGGWLLLAPLLVGTFTGTVNNAIVNVPMVDILTDLKVSLANGALVVVAFNLAFAVLMPLSGWLGDRIGQRRIFCIAMAGLAVGAVGAALSPNLGTLVAFRVMQGVATAAVLPGVMSLIAALVDPAKRGRAVGLWAAVNGAGQAVGPALGGLLSGWFGWRSIFYPMVPLALLSLVMTVLAVPKVAPRPVPLEWRGGLLLTLAATLLLGAASAVPSLGAGSPVVWTGGALGAAASLAFLLVERGRSGAFLRPGLLVEPTYLRAAVCVSAQMFCLGATLLGVPLYLVREGHMPTVSAGLVVLTMPLTMAVLAPVAGVATERHSPRVALRWGLGVLVLGELALTFLLGQGHRDEALLVLTLVVVGAGVAFVQTPAATAVTHSRAGQAGPGLGLFNLLRFGASALGASWVAAVLGGGARYATLFTGCVVMTALGLAAAFLIRPAGPDTSRPVVRDAASTIG
jgi:MFS family permease